MRGRPGEGSEDARQTAPRGRRATAPSPPPAARAAGSAALRAGARGAVLAGVVLAEGERGRCGWASVEGRALEGGGGG